MDSAAKEKLNAFNEKQSDWYTKCPKCGMKLKGTLKEITAHKCEEKK